MLLEIGLHAALSLSFDIILNEIVEIIQLENVLLDCCRVQQLLYLNTLSLSPSTLYIFQHRWCKVIHPRFWSTDGRSPRLHNRYQ